MHNPFQLYSSELLDSLIKAGHKYFLRQTYKRGKDHFDETTKNAFLITHYNDLNKARIHFEALSNDGNRFLYDISNDQHLLKLKTAASQPEGYKIFTPLLLEPWQPSDTMKGKIRRYIHQKLNWNPSVSDTVHSNLFTQFGELFITLKFKRQEIKIPLTDIERL